MSYIVYGTDTDLEEERTPPEPVTFVMLDKEVLGDAACVGTKRKTHQYRAHFLGEVHPDRSGERMDLNNDPWNSVLSAVCERGTADKLGLKWPGDFLSREHTIDIPPDIEVRYTHYDNLRLYTKDDPRSKYVLVTGKIPEFTIRGWLQGKDGKLPRYIDRKYVPGSYSVPIAHLRPFRELKQIVESDARYDPYRLRS